MKIYSYLFLILMGAFFFQSSLSQEIYNNLKLEFQNPPDYARPKVYYWWLNGYVDTIRLKDEIKAMHDQGIRGFDIFEIGVSKSDTITPAGPAFLSDESLNTIKKALHEAEKYKMEVGLNLASSWNAGGSWVTPQHASKAIYMSKIHLDKNSATNGAIPLPFPEVPKTNASGEKTIIVFNNKSGKPVFYEELAVIAVPLKKKIDNINDIQNLTALFDNKREVLNWNIPEGEWDIYRFISSNSTEKLMIPSFNSDGAIIDHYDAEATTMHLNYIIDKLKTIIPDFKESPLKSFYLASYEAKGKTWTPTLPKVFENLHGYEIERYLPLLFEKDLYASSLSEKFQKDFRETLSELMINNFYRKAKEISNRHGLKLNSEAGGPGYPLHNVPVEPLKSLGSIDIPRGEFWINHNRLNKDGIDILRVVKEVSAASNIYQRKIVEQEAFTTFQHWQEAPIDMKPYGDRAFCEGMNRVVFHGFTHHPNGTGKPGNVYVAGTHYNDVNIWWSKTNPFNEYLSRISYIFQNADFYADVLYYYGDHTPNYTGHKNSRFTVGPGFDYEVINTEIFTQLSMEDNEIKLPSGAKFKLLALEPEKEINIAVLNKIAELVKEGAIIIGEKPEKAYGDINQETKKLINDLWNPSNKNGYVISDVSPLKKLQNMGIQPDLSYSNYEFNDLDYIHYQKKGLDFYLVRNTQDYWISKKVSFRQLNKVPEIWDPENGKVITLNIYKQNNGLVTIPISLPPHGALIFVFKKENNNAKYNDIKGINTSSEKIYYYDNNTYILDNGSFELSNHNEQIIFDNQVGKQTIKGAWEIFFPEEMGTPKRIIMPELLSWTESENKSVKYFSGTATYRKTFQYDINSNFKKEGQKIFINLGNISKIADVTLNDTNLGITWTQPHWFDITNILKPGDNTLTIDVSNTWSNRLTGDAITGENYTKTNIGGTNISGLNKVHVPWAQVPLIKSGLLGPVEIFILNPIP